LRGTEKHPLRTSLLVLDLFLWAKTAEEKKMSQSSEVIAAHILRLAAGREFDLDQVQLQGLTYIAHGWWLAQEGEPLTTDRPRAEVFGPEYRALADLLKSFGIRALPTSVLDQSFNASLSDRELEHLASIVSTHGRLKGFQLSAVTRIPRGAWENAIAHGYGQEIQDGEIRRQFQELGYPAPTLLR
jgi:uncharacterized phage-associated protein